MIKIARALALTLVLLTGACASDSDSRTIDAAETAGIVGIAIGAALIGWSVLP